VAFVEFWYYFL